MDELVFVGFFAEMEVGRDGVLKEVNDQIAQKNKKSRGASAQFEAFGNHLDQSCCQHESRAQRDKVAEVTPLPMPLHDDGAAEDIGRGGGQA